MSDEKTAGGAGWAPPAPPERPGYQAPMNQMATFHRVADVEVVLRYEIAAPGDRQYPDGLYVTKIRMRDESGVVRFEASLFGVESKEAPRVTVLVNGDVDG